MDSLRVPDDELGLLQQRPRKRPLATGRIRVAEDSEDNKDDIGPIDDIDEIPPAVRYQELHELKKLRHVLRRVRKNTPTTFWSKLQRWYLYPFLEVATSVLCLFLPEIYKERYRKLSYAVLEPDTWPNMFTDPKARRRASAAWKSYANSLVDEWNSSNVIAALVLSAAGSFLAIPDINNVSRYALMITMLSSLASLAHATYHATYWRGILDDRHYSMLQLRCYISCYRPINRFLLCQPMLNLIYAMASFSVGLLAYLWPSQTQTWTLNAAARISISMIYGWQIGLVGAAYRWNQSAFFTTNALLVGEEGRRAKVYEDEEKRGEDMLRKMEADKVLAQNVPTIQATTQRTFRFIRSIPMASLPLSPDAVPPPNSPSSSKVRADVQPSFPIPQPFLEPVRWIKDTMGHVPKSAVPLGFENAHEPGQIYAGRMFYKGRWRSGRVGEHISSNFPYQGKDIGNMVEYEVLCGDPSHFIWLEVTNGDAFDSAIPLPAGVEFMTSNSSAPAGKKILDQSSVYVAAVDYNGGRQLGEVLHGSKLASIPFVRNELRLAPFFVLLVKKGSRVDQPTSGL